MCRRLPDIGPVLSGEDSSLVRSLCELPPSPWRFGLGRTSQHTPDPSLCGTAGTLGQTSHWKYEAVQFDFSLSQRIIWTVLNVRSSGKFKVCVKFFFLKMLTLQVFRERCSGLWPCVWCQWSRWYTSYALPSFSLQTQKNTQRWQISLLTDGRTHEISSNILQITYLQSPCSPTQTPGLVHWSLLSCRLSHGSGTAPEAPGLTGHGKMCFYSDLLLQSSPGPLYSSLPRRNPTQLCHHHSLDRSRTEPGIEWSSGKQQVGMQVDQVDLKFKSRMPIFVINKSKSLQQEAQRIPVLHRLRPKWVSPMTLRETVCWAEPFLFCTITVYEPVSAGQVWKTSTSLCVSLLLKDILGPPSTTCRESKVEVHIKTFTSTEKV